VKRIGIAGAGLVARALGRALAESGSAVVCVASRDMEHAAAAAAFLGCGAVPAPYSVVARHASHVLIAVSDSAIASVAEELGAGFAAALHTCGNYGAEILRPLASRGVSCGALHPLQTVRGSAEELRGIGFAISGDAGAVAWAEEIARSLGGEILRLDPDRRAFYHSAAVMASNYIAALLDAAQELMTMAGVERDQALRALAPLALAAVRNAAIEGPRQALTGPVARGDAATVEAHVGALQSHAGLLELYRAAGLRALEMARARGLDERSAAAMAGILARQ
jgi:predicted short-subunit dehydrogenase-like oxidoreductase (DUF2520 family)